MTDDLLSDKEYEDIRKALIEWFKSQSIEPKQAGVVMVQLMADLVTEVSLSTDRLQESIRIHHECFTMEVEWFRRKKLKSLLKGKS